MEGEAPKYSGDGYGFNFLVILVSLFPQSILLKILVFEILLLFNFLLWERHEFFSVLELSRVNCVELTCLAYIIVWCEDWPFSPMANQLFYQF